MSFGFGVGDLIAVGKLIKDISSILEDATGSKSEYQEILRELESLQQALIHLDRLQATGSNSTTLDSIKHSALSCRRPLEEFLHKIQKYKKSLGVWGKEGIIRTTADKLKWAYAERNDIERLQNYLSIHIGTINIFLTEYGLERMSLASDRGEKDQFHVRERLDETRTLLDKIGGSIIGQARAIAATDSMLNNLFRMVNGEISTSLKSFGEMVFTVCVATQQIYTVVLEIKAKVGPGTPDVRWSFFQEPILLEDALGRKFPVPSEYDYDLLKRIIEQKFIEGPGALDVASGNFELFNAHDKSIIISPDMKLVPGTKITMAIIIPHQALLDQTCPMPRCRSDRSTLAAGGGRLCCECGVWFGISSKDRKNLDNLADAANQPEPIRQELAWTEHPPKQTQLNTEESMPFLRNIKISLRNDSGKFTLEVRPGPPHTIDDALAYLDLVKVEYSDNPHVYEQFLKIMRGFKRGKLDTLGVWEQVKTLVGGKENLIEEFKCFLPPPGTWNDFASL